MHRRFTAQVAVFITVLACASTAGAHRLDPGLLFLEATGTRVTGTWTPPVNAPDVLPRLPDGCTPRSPPAGARALRAACPSPFHGTIERTGPGASMAEVVVRLRRDGHVDTATLDADSPAMQVSAHAGPMDRTSALVQALQQGIPHVLGGADHVLFVVGLVLLIRSPGRLLGAVAAFTLTHSMTLGLAALGALHLPSRPVEACIALSILLLAIELRIARNTLARRRPWLLAGLFGLVHGLGFAGSLAEAGIPPGRAIETLLGFNIGVEIGQLAIIACALPAVTWTRRGPAWRQRLPEVVLGAAGLAWTLDRTLVMLPW